MATCVLKVGTRRKAVVVGPYKISGGILNYRHTPFYELPTVLYHGRAQIVFISLITQFHNHSSPLQSTTTSVVWWTLTWSGVRELQVTTRTATRNLKTPSHDNSMNTLIFLYRRKLCLPYLWLQLNCYDLISLKSNKLCIFCSEM